MAKTASDRTKFNHRPWYYLLAALWLAYVFMMTQAPINHANLEHYGISLPWYYFIQFTFAVSILVIWILAMYGAVAFKRYAYSIRQSADGSALNTGANGLMVLVMGIIVTGLLTQARNDLANTDLVPVITIAANQVQVLGYLIGFYLLWRGSDRLVKQIRASSQSQRWLRWLLLPFVALAGTYAYLSSVDPNSLVATTPHVRFATYYLPAIWQVPLIIMPYVLSWLLALLAASNLNIYRKNVKGLLYRQSLTGLVHGIVAVTIFSICMQLLRTVSSSLLNLNTAGILILVYIILLAYTGSYLLIARGARRLQAIEEAV